MEKVEMELLKRHTHEGVELQPPAKIQVDARKVNGLVEQGIAKKSTGPKSVSRPAAE